MSDRAVCPPWLVRERTDSLSWLEAHGFPTQKDEDWRYTPLHDVLAAPLEPAVGPPAATAEHAGLLARLPDLGGPRLVFVNGFFVAELSRSCSLPRGATVASLAKQLEAGGDDAVPHAGPPAFRHGWEALNRALAGDGAFVHLPAGSVLDEPVHLVHILDSTESPVLASPWSVVVAGPGSAATVIESYRGTGGTAACTNARTDVVLSDGAALEHVAVQDAPLGATHLASLHVRQGRRSRFRSRSVALGGQLARHEVGVSLEGEEAWLELAGLFLPGAGQRHDNPVLVDHLAPGCTSRQLYKGVVDADAHGIFNGRIVVRHGAYATDASQVNPNLLLSDKGEVDTRPRLEIFADEVLCSHGAAVGRLDEEALFYARSRGLPEGQARAMLVAAFAEEVVGQLVPPALAGAVRAAVATRLGDGPLSGSGELRP